MDKKHTCVAEEYHLTWDYGRERVAEHNPPWPPRCMYCGRFMPWPKPLSIKEQVASMNLSPAKLKVYLDFNPDVRRQMEVEHTNDQDANVRND